MKLVGVVAVDNNWIIGIDGQLPWNCKEDLLHFKHLTSQPDSALLMGRKTAFSLPGPLRGRPMVIISKDLDAGEKLYDHFLRNGSIKQDEIDVSIAETVTFCSLDSLFANASTFLEHIDTLYVCGGRTIYSSLLDHCDEIYITVLSDSYLTFDKKYQRLIKEGSERTLFPVEEIGNDSFELLDIMSLGTTFSGIEIGNVLHYVNTTKRDNVFNIDGSEWNLYQGRKLKRERND